MIRKTVDFQAFLLGWPTEKSLSSLSWLVIIIPHERSKSEFSIAATHTGGRIYTLPTKLEQPFFGDIGDSNTLVAVKGEDNFRVLFKREES